MKILSQAPEIYILPLQSWLGTQLFLHDLAWSGFAVGKHLFTYKAPFNVTFQMLCSIFPNFLVVSC